MMKTLRNALLVASVAALPVVALTGTANAQPVSGVYLGAGVGINNIFNTDGKSNLAGITLKPQIGGIGALSAGYGFGNGLRAELEFDYTGQNSKASGFGGSTKGDVYTYGVMANALYDIDAGLGWMYPYVGAGAGMQWMALSGGFGHAQSSGNFAAQGIIGAAFPVGVPGLSVTADARYMSTFGDTNFRHGNKLDSFQQLSGLIGVRYAFGAPAPAPTAAPAPMAAPAPAPVRTYLVFFDWDKSDLTARARQIIAEAAQASTRVQTTRIEVDGYTDKSGTPAYNQALSIRRAKSVASELVRLGVAQQAISIQGFGETKPLVPTADGVREPQNRRVEIILK
jgi:outer membrane protein OmpA-like peptidoglycan-associated protein